MVLRLRETYGRELRYQRAAATAIALRLYELEHGGRPAALAELAPAYISAVPRDPFDAGEAPLEYLPDADPPVISVRRRNSSHVPWAYYLNGDRPQDGVPKQ